jgi:hypothetical protein
MGGAIKRPPRFRLRPPYWPSKRGVASLQAIEDLIGPEPLEPVQRLVEH